MTGVKRSADPGAPLPALVGFVFQQVRDILLEEDWGGLRNSHLRVLHSIADDTVSVTELANRLRMTKQGAGQFVTWLAERGYVVVEGDPGDRRTRLVRRTAQGTGTVQRFARRMTELECQWAQEVGPDRYEVFRSVLQALSRGDQSRRSATQAVDRSSDSTP